ASPCQCFCLSAFTCFKHPMCFVRHKRFRCLPFTLCPPFGGCGVGAAVENMPAIKKRKGKEPFNAPCPFVDLCVPSANRRRRELNASGAAVTDGHFATFHDDGHLAGATRVAEHFVQKLRVGLDIAVVHFVALLGIVLTGCPCIGSAVLAVDDDDLLRHDKPLLALRNIGRQK
ncbi:MAG: hypothetical protein YPKNTGVA_002679, partial [Candidatus Fervidibacter sp.]